MPLVVLASSALPQQHGSHLKLAEPVARFFGRLLVREGAHERRSVCPSARTHNAGDGSVTAVLETCPGGY
jgi:hypothetical protein